MAFMSRNPSLQSMSSTFSFQTCCARVIPRIHPVSRIFGNHRYDIPVRRGIFTKSSSTKPNSTQAPLGSPKHNESRSNHSGFRTAVIVTMAVTFLILNPFRGSREISAAHERKQQASDQDTWKRAAEAGDSELWRKACFDIPKRKFEEKGLSFEENTMVQIRRWRKGHIMDPEDVRVFLVKRKEDGHSATIKSVYIAMNLDRADPNCETIVADTWNHIDWYQLRYLRETGRLSNPYEVKIVTRRHVMRDCMIGWHETINPHAPSDSQVIENAVKGTGIWRG